MSTGPDAVRASVCMPAYAPGPYFEEALESALAQSERRIEVIVTDDSGGDLRESVERSGDRRVRYFANATRLGFAGNHSKALSEARAPAVAFLQHDDVWKRDFLSSSLEVLEREPSVGIVIVGVDDIGPSGEAWGSRPTRGLGGGMVVDPLLRYLSKDFTLMLPSGTVFRAAALLDATRPWPDLNAADVGVYLELSSAGWGTYFVDKQLAKYRSHAGQTSVNMLSHRDSVVRLLELHQFSECRAAAALNLRLAQALVARAGVHARLRDGGSARRDLREASSRDASVRDARWFGLFMLSFLTRVVPLLHRAWQRFYFNPVARRHEG